MRQPVTPRLLLARRLSCRRGGARQRAAAKHQGARHGLVSERPARRGAAGGGGGGGGGGAGGAAPPPPPPPAAGASAPEHHATTRRRTLRATPPPRCCCAREQGLDGVHVWLCILRAAASVCQGFSQAQPSYVPGAVGALRVVCVCVCVCVCWLCVQAVYAGCVCVFGCWLCVCVCVRVWGLDDLWPGTVGMRMCWACCSGRAQLASMLMDQLLRCLRAATRVHGRCGATSRASTLCASPSRSSRAPSWVRVSAALQRCCWQCCGGARMCV
jgi:hypothetical protein